MLRTTGAVLALLMVMLAVVVGPAVAQESTPAAQGSPVAVQQPVTIGDTEVSWSGNWQYDETGSVEAQQAALEQSGSETSAYRLATYSEVVDETVDGPDAFLDTFAQQYFESAGAQSVQEVGSGELENGAVWKVYNFQLEGVQLALLVTVNQNDNSEYVTSTLTANTDSFAESISAVQQEIMLDGEPTFLEGVQIEEVTANLGAVASPQASPAATPPS